MYRNLKPTLLLAMSLKWARSLIEFLAICFGWIRPKIGPKSVKLRLSLNHCSRIHTSHIIGVSKLLDKIKIPAWKQEDPDNALFHELNENGERSIQGIPFLFSTSHHTPYNFASSFSASATFRYTQLFSFAAASFLNFFCHSSSISFSFEIQLSIALKIPFSIFLLQS